MDYTKEELEEITKQQLQVIFDKEKERNPEVYKILRKIVMNQSNILYKKGLRFKKIPCGDLVSMFKFEKDIKFSWQLDVRMNKGEPRLIIAITDYKAFEYLDRYAPGINYIPEALLLEDYGKKWKEVK